MALQLKTITHSGSGPEESADWQDACGNVTDYLSALNFSPGLRQRVATEVLSRAALEPGCDRIAAAMDELFAETLVQRARTSTHQRGAWQPVLQPATMVPQPINLESVRLISPSACRFVATWTGLVVVIALVMAACSH